MKKNESVLIYTDRNNNELIAFGKQLAFSLNISYNTLYSNAASSSIFLKLENGELKESKQKPHVIINNIKKELEIIFIITDINFNEKKLNPYSINIIKELKKAELGILYIKTPYDIKIFNEIILYCGYRKENKEKIAWSNYFSKKLDKEPKLIIPKEKDEYIINDINNNYSFAKKLYSKSKINPNIIKSKLETDKLKYNINLYKNTEDSLYIINMNEFTPLQFILMPTDIKIIQRNMTNAIFLVPKADNTNIPCH